MPQRAARAALPGLRLGGLANRPGLVLRGHFLLFRLDVAAPVAQVIAEADVLLEIGRVFLLDGLPGGADRGGEVFLRLGRINSRQEMINRRQAGLGDPLGGVRCLADQLVVDVCGLRQRVECVVARRGDLLLENRRLEPPSSRALLVEEAHVVDQ